MRHQTPQCVAGPSHLRNHRRRIIRKLTACIVLEELVATRNTETPPRDLLCDIVGVPHVCGV